MNTESDILKAVILLDGDAATPLEIEYLRDNFQPKEKIDETIEILDNLVHQRILKRVKVERTCYKINDDKVDKISNLLSSF